MKKSIIKSSVLAILIGSLFTAGTPVYAEEVIATVGEEEITQEEFYTAMKNLAGEITLRSLILEEVLMKNVEDPEVNRANAEEEVKLQIEEAGGEDAFQELLNYQQLGTTEEFTYQLFINDMFQEVVTKHIDTSDEALKAYYDDGYKPTMEAQHILVETKEEAQDVIQRLNNGEDFDEVAKEVSLDSTAENGGLLTPFTEGQMVPEFEEAVKGQKNGEVTQEPVETDYGFHVIKTIDNGEKKPFEEVRDDVKQQYVDEKLADSEFSYKVIGDLVKEAGVEIHDKDLQKAVDDILKAAETEESSSEDASGDAAASDDESASEATEAESAE